jgi:hypothetical protein
MEVTEPNPNLLERLAGFSCSLHWQYVSAGLALILVICLYLLYLAVKGR